MSNTNERKSQQLGMPIGTAQNRLRKLVLFMLLAKYGDNVCYQCGQTILSADALSIEHKVPWLDKDPALFWDLDNIAFSHLSCNIGAARRDWLTPEFYQQLAEKSKKSNATETWCYICKLTKPNNLFSKNKDRWNGLQNACNECRSNTRKKDKE